MINKLPSESIHNYMKFICKYGWCTQIEEAICVR